MEYLGHSVTAAFQCSDSLVYVTFKYQNITSFKFHLNIQPAPSYLTIAIIHCYLFGWVPRISDVLAQLGPKAIALVVNGVTYKCYFVNYVAHQT